MSREHLAALGFAHDTDQGLLLLLLATSMTGGPFLHVFGFVVIRRALLGVAVP